MQDPSAKPPAPEAGPSIEMSTPKRILKITLAFACLILALYAGSTAGNLVSNALGETDDILSYGDLVMVLVRSILAVIGFLLLGGKRWFRFDKSMILKAAWFSFPLLIVNTVLGMLVIESIFVPKSLGGDGGELAPGGIGQAAFSLVLMLLVGLNEEVIFRGLGLGGMLLGFGRKKHGALIAAILTSLAFGLAHVMFDIDFSDISTVLNGGLKMLQTAMLGIVLCCCVLTGQNLWGAIAVHAFYDWIILVGSLLKPAEYEVDYVAPESPSPLLSDSVLMIAQCIFYVLIIVIYLPRTIRAIKLLHALPPTSGPFADIPENGTAG